MAVKSHLLGPGSEQSGLLRVRTRAPRRPPPRRRPGEADQPRRGGPAAPRRTAATAPPL